MQLTGLLVPTYTQMLGALAQWLGKAQAQLSATEADALLAARLAPDMFPLSTQVRFACVQAYEGVYRLTGQPFPPMVEELLDEGRNGGTHPGTLAGARGRIDGTLAFLDTLDPTLLDAAETKPVELALPIGLTFDLTGTQNARDWALAQFYFHVMTAYAILRHHGVEIGKADYVGHMFGYLRQAPDGDAAPVAATRA
jgi:hypothetical protein